MDAVSGVAWLFFVLIAVFILLIPVFIGTYIYKDAKSRGMDAVLWTLAAVLVPGFVGLIIYLVIRSNNPNVNCPSCRKPVSDEYVLCPAPNCGVSLKEVCPSCNAP
jgi:ABC-type transport system involved in multi-copper enzyme maturation permease subunit